MNITELKALLSNRTIVDFETDDQDFAHGLRVVLMDVEGGEIGLLVIEPRILVLPDEVVLDYSYQVIDSRLGPPEQLYDIATKVNPDYDASDVPFLKGEQEGLF